MPHVALVAFTGFRVREQEMLELGMTLPGLKQRGQAIGQLPALGLLTLAGMTPEQWTCSYHETGSPPESTVEKVLATRPTLVAISALTASVEEAYRFSTQIRAAGVPTVLGGLHATACPDEAQKFCNSVVVGDGEPVWLELLHDALNGTLRPLYRAAAPFDLSLAPVPRFDLLGPTSRPRYTLQTQRGCPLACEFCGASRLLGSFREKPIENLRREVAALGKLCSEPLLELADDNTFAGRRDPESFFEVLESLGTRYFTEVDWRIGKRPDVLAGLARSGCVQVLVGIESLVFRAPGMGAKGQELARIMAAIEAIQESGIAVLGCLIVGCDGETDHSLDRLAEFLISSPLADVQLTLQTPFPGTSLHGRLQRQGRLLPERSWSYYTLFDATYYPDRMKVVELEAGFRRVIRAVFAPAVAARRQGLRKRIWQKHPRFRTWAY
jgi:radical SAM superfamily enzyme YgiQ (UPF0313 family)